MGPTKLEVVTQFFYPVSAGIEMHCLEMYSRLGDDFNVTVHTSRCTLTRKNSLETFEKVGNLQVLRYDWFPLGFLPQLTYEKSIVHLHNFNIFPHFWVFTNVIMGRLKKRRIRLLVTPHGGFTPDWAQFSIISRAIKVFYNRTFGKFALNYLTDIIIAVSEWEKRELSKKGIHPAKIVVLGNGVEDLAFENIENSVNIDLKNQVREFGKYMVQVGRLSPIKNQRKTIKVLANFPDLKYLVMGSVQDSRYYNKCRELAEELGLKDRVFFLGEVTGEKKFYLLRNALMFVALSDLEADSIAVKEAMSQGLVCIVSDNGGLPYLVEDKKNGFVVKDSENAVKCIKFLLNKENRDLMEGIRRNNVLKAQAFKWDNIVRHVKEIYDLL